MSNLDQTPLGTVGPPSSPQDQSRKVIAMKPSPMTSPATITALRRSDDTTAPSSLDGLPLMLTISEAAVVLRVSRTTAYKLAELHRRTKGVKGLPHVQMGSRLLVRRVDLAAIVGLPPPAG
jgi:excisionase family DNA binding protein